MFCKKCGATLTNNDKFCPGCGTPVESPVDTQVYQQPVQTNNMNQPVQSNNNQPKDDSNKYIAIGIVVVIVIVLFYIVTSSLKSGVKGNISTPATQTASKSNYSVKYNGFVFSVPDNLIYELSNGALNITDEAETWAATIETVEGSFDQFKQKKSLIVDSYKQKGYNPRALDEKDYDGVDIITVEVTEGGQNGIVGIAKLNSMYSVCFVLYNQDNDNVYDYINQIAPIIKTAKVLSEANGIKVNMDLGIDDISSLMQ